MADFKNFICNFNDTVSFFLFFSLKKFEKDLNQYSERFFRIINEIPTILLLIIVSLVVFQPII